MPVVPSTIALTEPTTGTLKLLDAVQVVVSSVTGNREVIVLADPITPGGYASILNAAPSTEYGLVVRPIPSGTQGVSGSVSLVGTSPVSGSVSITGTVTVSGTATVAQAAVFGVSGVDGAIATLGATADAAVGDAAGTVNAHVRQIAKTLAGTLTVTGTFSTPLATLSTAVISVTGSGQTALVTATSAQVIKVYRILFTTSAATNITLQNGNTGLTGAIPFGIFGSLLLEEQGSNQPWFTTTAGNSFNINSSVAVTIAGAIWYTIA